jgi:hypothetical protein
MRRHHLLYVVLVGVIAFAVFFFVKERQAAHHASDEPPVPPAPAGGAGGAAGETPRAAADAAPGAPDRAAIEKLRRDIAQARATRRASAPAAAPAPTPAGGGEGGAPVDGDAPLDKEYIRAAIGEIKPLLVECYNEALERDPQLAGQLVVTFRIAGEPELGGVVESSEIEPGTSTITDEGMLECVRESIYAARFAAPGAGGTVLVRYPFAFASDDGDGGPAAPPKEPR